MYKRILKNQSGVAKTYVGQTIPAGSVYDIPQNELPAFKQSSSLFNDVIAGDIVINDGSTDITDAHAAWTYLTSEVREVEIMQKTEALGGKVSVHSSAKPVVDGHETYSVWSGAGDIPSGWTPGDPVKIGGGDLLNFQMTINDARVTKYIIWDQQTYGRVWIHEAYLKFTGAGNGDYISAYVVAKASPIVDNDLGGAVSLDLEKYSIVDPDNISHDFYRYAAGGPGTGTHAFAGTPVLIPREFSKDGDWNYDTVNGLTPAPLGDGQYKISDTDYRVSKYINRIPCYGDCATFFSMSSSETAEIRDGYYMEVICENSSGSNWQASVIMEIYRERTVY